MAKEVKAEKESNNLPAYTTAENVLLLLDTYRKKNGSEKDSRPTFGKAGSAYTNSRSALRFFGLINESDCGFTDLGRKVAYSKEEEKKQELLRVILSYFPYESLLNNILQKGKVTETDIDTITNFWGKFKYGSTQRNLEEAAKLFMNMVEYVGMGKFVKGSKIKPTRIEWFDNAYEMFNNIIAETGEPAKPAEINTENAEETIDVFVPTDEEEKADLTPSYEQPAITYEAKQEEKFTTSIITKPFIAPNITINVDMSDWPEEKIKSFFKYAYGKFEEETE